MNIATGRRYTGQTMWIGYPQSDDRFLREAKRRQQLGTKVAFLHFRSSTNPWLPRDYEERQMRNYGTVEEWRAVCQIIPGSTFPARNSYFGDVFRGTDFPEGNLIDISIDRDHPTMISMDPGNASYSVLFWQYHLIHGEPKAIILDEWAPSRMTTDRQAVDEILARGYNLERAFIDPYAGNARSRQEAEGRSTVELLSRPVDGNRDGRGGGLGCEVIAHFGARSSVAAGISRARARLRRSTKTSTTLNSLSNLKPLSQRGENAFGRLRAKQRTHSP